MAMNISHKSSILLTFYVGRLFAFEQMEDTLFKNFCNCLIAQRAQILGTVRDIHSLERTDGCRNTCISAEPMMIFQRLLPITETHSLSASVRTDGVEVLFELGGIEGDPGQAARDLRESVAHLQMPLQPAICLRIFGRPPLQAALNGIKLFPQLVCLLRNFAQLLIELLLAVGREAGEAVWAQHNVGSWIETGTLI